MINREKISSFVGIVLIILLFVASSYFAQWYVDELGFGFRGDFIGMLIYVLVSVASIVVAPVSVMPLMPLASTLWGWQVAGVLSIIGWVIGAVIAFVLARRYGVPLVSKLLPMKAIYKFEKKIPDENLFWTVVFFRMVIPVDGLSYFLGLFSKMTLRSYTLATLIGITPFAFVFAYVGTIDFYFQMLFMSLALIVFLVGLLVAWKRGKKVK
ncbi:MAG: hypothetical protein CMG78_05815 [Marinobacter sp.]|nr:hypothetical protein [Marinobacter sp.]|tara:strand:- start:192 stop:824 length:633 start_codon:yes stop_codon:yes gene_type:complete